jgi:predicted transglutaminase-like cysteine proteinase
MSMIRCRLLPVLFLFWVGLALAGGLLLDDRLLSWVKAKYGAAAELRVSAWRDLMADSQGLDEAEKLRRVNSFFNRLPWSTDRLLWGKEDYWATPIEMLAIDGADCEDYSIAKYFTLRELGVPEEKLRIMYVKALELNQAHMVLTYYATPDAVPLVLDNIKPDILPADQRPDLAPVYSFNASSLWLAKQRGKGRLVGESARISLWRDLQQRMATEGQE